MIRIFSILSVLTVIMIVVAGGGIYWVSQSDVNQAKQDSIESLAKGLTLSVTSQLNTLQKAVVKMAVAPEVITAIESENEMLMAQTAEMLEQYLPHVMKIRLLPANVSELDEINTPHMGNADLVMAQETLIEKQTPVIQGQGKNRHLAISASIKRNGTAIGVILASINYNFLQSSFNHFSIKNGFFELKQDNASLAKKGTLSDNTNYEGAVKVPQTLWTIHYSSSNTTKLTTLSIFAGIVFIPVLLTCLAFFISYRRSSSLLTQDQSSIVKAVKDLMSGKNVGSYPVNITEMKAVISTLIQFKRVLESDGTDFSEKADTDLDNFFDDPTGLSFLDMNLDTDDKETKSQTIESTPVSLPVTEEENNELPDSFAFDTQNSENSNSKPTIFKAYDIRGIVGDTLTKEIIFDIGRAVGSEAKDKNIKTIVLGRDGRTTSLALAESFAKGIVTTGVNILDIGLIPSPVVYFVAQHTEGKSGVVITGSHNPVEYNGLKIIINGETLANEKIQKLKQRIDTTDYLTGETGSIEQNSMFTNEYIGMISEDVHIVRPMKVVVDCGNGAAGELAPVLLKTLGCEVVELFCDIDGTFPNHHPDPSNPENLTDLITAVQHYNADVGIAFDGDGDRLGVVDSKGKIIWPDRQMMLFAKNVLASKPGSEIIFDVKCTRHLGEQITKNGGRPLMWKTGHSLMKAKLKETGAALAGEMSGHIFFNDRWFGFDDALYSASRLIEILSADSRNSNEVFSDFPDSVNTPEIYVSLDEGSTSFMEQVFATANFKGGKIIHIDGMRVEFEDGWGLVRASNTLPSLSLRFEANNKEALDRIQSQFKQLLTEIKPDLALPF